MNGKEHLFFATVTASASQYVALSINPDIPIQNTIMFVTCAALGGLLPDIDLPGTMITKIFGILKPISVFIFRIFGHRTYIHDLGLWSIIFTFLSIYYQNIFIYGLAFGYIGHLILDSTTAGGIPIFYLFNKKMFHLFPYKWKFKSSSKIATFITVLFTAIYSLTAYMIVDKNFFSFFI